MSKDWSDSNMGNCTDLVGSVTNQKTGFQSISALWEFQDLFSQVGNLDFFM